MAKVQNVSRLRALAITYSGGSKVIATRGVNARRPEDFAGLRLMFGSSPVSQHIAQQLGVETYIAPIEGFAALAANDLVDGIETTPARFVELEQHRAASVMINTGHSLLTTMIVINKTFFQRLPESYQRIVQRAALDTGRVERQRSLDANHAALRNLPQQGVEVVELSATEKQTFERKLRPVYDAVSDLVPHDLIASIRRVGNRPVTAQR